jgi:hypothetical protein
MIQEPARSVPVVADVDVCVLGGSCTGVFAAVRAARLGCTVALVEKQNCFGGVATAGLVNIWHSAWDTEGRQRILAGLTQEVVARLQALRAATPWEPKSPDAAVRLNTEELKIELDRLVLEHRIEPFLHTLAAGALVEAGAVRAVFLENKDGRTAIQAKVFVDATGDGDLARLAGIPFTLAECLQPPTTCAKIRGAQGLNLRDLYRAHREEFGLPEDSGWNGSIPFLEDIRMHADTHVFDVNAADAGQLTRAEIEGRRRIRAVMDMIRKHHPERAESLCLLDLAATLGIRETRRFHTDYILTETDVLEGVRFPDAIANGSYRVDVHYPAGGGFLFKYLDGTQSAHTARGVEKGRWRPPREVNPTFYQIPFRCLVRREVRNLVLAGRMIGTDAAAFGAVRVMVNTNQTGEAAGVAAALAVRRGIPVAEVDPADLRQTLALGGSVIL